MCFFKKKEKTPKFDMQRFEPTLTFHGFVKDSDDCYSKTLNEKSTLYFMPEMNLDGIVLQWATDYEKYEIPEEEHEKMYERCYQIMEKVNFNGELMIVDFDMIEYFIKFTEVKDIVAIESCINLLEDNAKELEKYLK